jgi:uncharacterized protein
MPPRDKSRLGEPCWIDLLTSDTDAARDFYEALFGWTTTQTQEEHGTYITFWQDEDRVAGLTAQAPGAEPPDAWVTYLSVADADATTAAARDAGAQILLEPVTVPGQGRLAFLTDPSGAAIGIWQSAEHTGYGRFGEYGTPVWHELSTRDFDAAASFYQTVFNWRLVPLSETDEFRYSIFGPEDDEVGGVFDARRTLPEGMPSSWVVYFGVPDVPEAAAQVAALGGRVIREPWDSEFGTFSQVSDPTGAVFLLSSVEDAATALDDSVANGHA